MSDLYLDPETMDLPDQPRLTDGDERIAQQIRGALQLEQGEHPEDASRGLPWSRWSSARRAPVDEIRGRCMAIVAGNPHVQRVAGVTAAVQGERVTVDLQAVLRDGRRLSFSPGWRLIHPSSPRITPRRLL